MKTCFLLLLASVSVSIACAQNQTVIAFGSCDDEAKPQEMWNAIIAQKPTLWVWGGDNIYAKDGEDTVHLKARYHQQKANPDYQTLLKNCTVTGTWDDHDYGTNDGGRFFTKKKENKKYLLDFLGLDKTNPVWKHEGVYNSTVVGDGTKKVKVINLDTRYFRDTTTKYSYVDTLTKKKLTNYTINESGDVLGEAQWQWLATELQNSDASFFILNSSIQVIPDQHRFEKWANFPKARKRLIDLIEASGKRVLIISGDRHMAEFSKFTSPKLTYPLYDFTSSGITHTWSEKWDEENRFRVGELIIQKTFGLIRIDWSDKGPKVTLQVKGLEGKTWGEQVIQY